MTGVPVRAILAVLAVLLSSCATISDYFRSGVAGDCVSLHCKDRDAQAFAACEAACLKEYR
jgi:hypothetical protein